MTQPTLSWPNAAALVRILEPLQALAIAILDEQGSVVDANVGFRRLIGADARAIDRHAADVMVVPTFEALRSSQPTRPDATVYRGRITLVHPAAHATSLRGEIRRLDGRYLLIAEHAIEELEAMAAAMIDLTEQMADTQRELIRAKKKLEARELELAELAVTDPLTGLANRRALDQRLPMEVARSERTETPLSIVMVDLDGFKGFNDRHGHLAGDGCLQSVARILMERTRPYDTVARYGGEEFVLLLPGTAAVEAASRAEDIRAAIAQTDLPGTDERITASFGVAQAAGRAPNDLLRTADEALYEAKRAGRNRIRTACS